MGLKPSSCFLRNYSPAGTPYAVPSVSASSWIVSAAFLQVVARAILGGKDGGRRGDSFVPQPSQPGFSRELSILGTHPLGLASAPLSLDPFSPQLTSPSDIQPT